MPDVPREPAPEDESVPKATSPAVPRDTNSLVPPSEIARRAIAAAVWLALLAYLPRLGNHLVPDATKAKISFQTFLIVCQILTLAIGVGASLALLRKRREGLGFAHVPRWSSTLASFFAVPLAFVVASYVAIQIALPTLLEELKTRGAHASQQNAGEFGRALAQAPLLVTLLWGPVLAGIGEELFFRGILWSTLTDLTRRLAPKRTPGAPGSPLDIALDVLLSGGIATIVCAALFGYMHGDVPGGVGIMRVASTTCLGLACGVVRQATGGVTACILFHATYDTLALGMTRRWFGADDKPVLDGIPNNMLALAVSGAIAIGAIAFVRALAARRARSVFVPD